MIEKFGFHHVTPLGHRGSLNFDSNEFQFPLREAMQGGLAPWEQTWPVVAGSPGCCLPCGRWPDTFAPNPICPNPLCPKPRLPLTPFAYNPTWKMTPLPSCNNGLSLFPKKPTLLALPPLGWSKISGRLWRRPSITKAVSHPPFPLSREKFARRPTMFLFQWSCPSSTPSRRGWPSVREMNTGPSTVGLWFASKEWQNQFVLFFFHCQLLNIISFTYACLFKQKLDPIIHLT